MTSSEFSKLLDEKLAEVASKRDLETLVTKEDAEKFATKKDLERFATKEGLGSVKEDIAGLREDARNFATKTDLERFATREDLGEVRGDVQKVEFQLKLTEQRFEQKLEDIFSKYSKEMLDKFDQVIGELQKIREENVFGQAQFERLAARVERLEQHVGLEPLL